MKSGLPQNDPESAIKAWRKAFPILFLPVRGKRLAYLDNGATTQKPSTVIESLERYYGETNANVHRGVHDLSERATAAYEQARAGMADFIGASAPEEIIFTRGTTEAINLVAWSYGELLNPGDEVLISALEHHSNIVPWQMLRDRRGITLKVVPITREGDINPDDFSSALSEKTALVALAHVSNALGTVNPIADMIAQAHAQGAVVLIDGAQAVAHMPVEVQKLDCDFYAFSGHKMYGPTGIGVLYGKSSLLERMPPWQGGGDMIRTVEFERSTYAPPPYKFEAGTPHIAGAIGMGKAAEYIRQVGFAPIMEHETILLDYALQQLQSLEFIRLIGTPQVRSSAISFIVTDVHPHDVGTILDHHGVAIRAGHHCAMPVMQFYQVPATVRASFALYNNHEDVDQLIDSLQQVREMFG